MHLLRMLLKKLVMLTTSRTGAWVKSNWYERKASVCSLLQLWNFEPLNCITYSKNVTTSGLN